MIIYLYKISIQYTNPFKRYRTETKSVMYGMDGTDRRDGHTDSGDTIWPPIENGGGIKIFFVIGTAVLKLCTLLMF